MPEDKTKKRFFWVEFVTRAEVEKSLADRRPSRLREQGPRRALVIAAAAIVIGLWLTPLIPHPKVSSYLSIVLVAASIVTYLKLRAAVRHVSDAPDELLDEWQIGARNRAYLVAYRWLALVAILFVILVLPGLSEGGWLHHGLRVTDSVSGIHMGFLMLTASLPAMALAWRMPSEPTE